MTNIYYCSSMQIDRFPENSRSKFASYIDINHLKNIPNENIEVAIKSIIYHNTVSHKKLVFKLDSPDMIIIKKFSRNEFSFSNQLRFKKNMRIHSLLDNEKILFTEYEDYIFDLREDRNELQQNTFIIKGFHTKFSSINLIINGEDKENTYLIQLIFLYDQTVNTNSELVSLLDYVYKNNLFIKDVKESKLLDKIKVLFGEQLSYMMDLKMGNITKRYNSLLSLLEDEERAKLELILQLGIKEKFQNKYLLGNYILNLMKNKNQHLYTCWTTPELYTSINILKQGILGLRTSIVDFSIRDNKFDQIASIWNSSKSQDTVVQIDFKNPSFFKTNKEKLSNAKFEIVNFTTNDQPYFGIGSPTYIHCIIREIKDPKMKQPFNVLLDSTCSESKKLYPENTPTNFKIKLAERIQFSRNWKVSLQSLFLSNKLFNISGDKFNFIYEETFNSDNLEKLKQHYNLNEIPNWETYESYTSNVSNVALSADVEQNENQNNYDIFFKSRRALEITDGCYSSLIELVDVINRDWEKNYVNLSMEINENRVVIKNNNQELFDIVLDISPYLAYTLGFTEKLDFNTSNTYKIRNYIKSTYDAKLSMLVPKYLIICCDIVDDTIFSGEHVKLLRMVVNNTASSEEIISFEFLHHDFVPINVKEFSTIHVTISDVGGNPIITNSNTATYLQLVFANV